MHSNFKQSLFLDSSNIEEVKRWSELEIVDGVTINQKILMHGKHKFSELYSLVKKISKVLGKKPLSVEFSQTSKSKKEMVKEALFLASLGKNVVVKIPIIPNSEKSFEVIYDLVNKKIPINITALMNFEQMIMGILCARNSQQLAFVSLFWSRSLEDHQKYRSKRSFVNKYPELDNESFINCHPAKIIEQARKFIENGGFSNIRIITGSIRSTNAVGEAFAAGSHIVTVTGNILKAMSFSKRTLETLEEFDQIWKKLEKQGD